MIGMNYLCFCKTFKLRAQSHYILNNPRNMQVMWEFLFWMQCILVSILMVQQSELLGQFRLIGEHALDVSGGRTCLTQNAYAEI